MNMMASFMTHQMLQSFERCGYSLLNWGETTLKVTSGGSVYMNRKEDGRVYGIVGTYIVGDTFVELQLDDAEKRLLSNDGKQILI